MAIIKIVDAIMGSGKSSWAIQYINEQKGPFLYVTPYLTEIDRIKTATRGRFCEPEHRGEGKLEGLKWLLAKGKNIVTTHQLFLHIDEEAKDLLRAGEYSCILDEELDVVRAYGDALPPDDKKAFSMNKDDVRYAINEGLISVVGDGKTGYARWVGPQGYPEFKYSRVREFAEKGTLICVDGIALFWMYPQDIFTLFDSVYVLTYQVEGSILYSYLRFHDLPFEKVGVCGSQEEGYRLCEYSPEADRAARRACASRLHILDITQNYNRENARKGILSSSWFQHASGKDLQEIKKTFETVRRTKLQCKSQELMWTTYQEYEEKLTGSGSKWTVKTEFEAEKQAKKEMEKERCAAAETGNTLRRGVEQFLKKYRCFVSLNTRATNNYSDRTKLAYLCNIHPNPEIQKFFGLRGAQMDEELFALNMMIQWIWRSAIRVDREIWIWVPAWRMRELLYEWLDQVPPEPVHRGCELPCQKSALKHRTFLKLS